MADNELVMAPLGGIGEIGMNATLYGFGAGKRRKWIMVDCGVSFAGPELPGVDLIFPDIAFIERIRNDLLGLIITHAHEDHIGAVPFLWPRLRCPVYATAFAAGLLDIKRLQEEGAPRVPLTVVAPGSRLDLGPFNIEFVRVAHSIPEATALAIRTEAGTVLHTGDWKIDATPGVGWPTDEKRLREIGNEGVLALVCDSTNILRDGDSPSEADVSATLDRLIAEAKGRVLVTTFASNVARLHAVAQAAMKAGRSVILAGRAMDRVCEVARELGMLEGLPDFHSPDAFSVLPRDRVVVLATGSQGESRAAVARIAEDEHPSVRLAPGDRVIFSSRPIPGNERAINEIINGLVKQGIEVITDRNDLVHVSGHPRRNEVARMYEWIRPKIAIPAHGEALHLAEHAAFARARGVPHVMKISNGDLVHLSPQEPGIIDQIQHGRQYSDGNLVIAADDNALRERKRLSYNGIVTVALATTNKGEMAGDPDVMTSGVPARTADGRTMDSVIDKAIFDTFESLPRNRRRDADTLVTALERAIRSAVGNVWGKRPQVHVLVIEI
jgi:ribonuclease J